MLHGLTARGATLVLNPGVVVEHGEAEPSGNRPRRGKAMTVSREHLERLCYAKDLLENPSPATRLIGILGTAIEKDVP